MSWSLVIGVPLLAMLLYAFKKQVDATPDPTKESIARTIAAFLGGKGDPQDWNNFVTYPLKDPGLESVRKECFEIDVAHSRKKPQEWCNQERVAQLRRILARLT